MGNLSKLILPDNTALDIKDASAVQSVVANTSNNTVTITMRNGTSSTFQLNAVTGVKGWAEQTYRTGDVEIALSDLGLDNVVLHDGVGTIESEVGNNYYTKAQIDQIVNTINAMTSSLQSAVGDNASDISDLSDRLDQNDISISNIESEFDNVVYHSDTGVSTNPINGSQYYTKTEVDTLLSQIRSSISTLSNSVQSFISQITALSDTSETHSTQITDLQDNMIHAE